MEFSPAGWLAWRVDTRASRTSRTLALPAPPEGVCVRARVAYVMTDGACCLDVVVVVVVVDVVVVIVSSLLLQVVTVVVVVTWQGGRGGMGLITHIAWGCIGGRQMVGTLIKHNYRRR